MAQGPERRQETSKGRLERVYSQWAFPGQVAAKALDIMEGNSLEQPPWFICTGRSISKSITNTR
eukprot:6237018-Prymnesium_polylepis.1